jgi:hypothetical protein
MVSIRHQRIVDAAGAGPSSNTSAEYGGGCYRRALAHCSHSDPGGPFGLRLAHIGRGSARASLCRRFSRGGVRAFCPRAERYSPVRCRGGLVGTGGWYLPPWLRTLGWQCSGPAPFFPAAQWSCCRRHADDRKSASSGDASELGAPPRHRGSACDRRFRSKRLVVGASLVAAVRRHGCCRIPSLWVYPFWTPCNPRTACCGDAGGNPDSRKRLSPKPHPRGDRAP